MALTRAIAKIFRFAATKKLLGRGTAGAGQGEELGLGTGLDITGGNLVLTGGSTGTSVAGTPIVVNPYAINVTSASTAHGLGGIPMWVTALLECLTADANWAPGDKILVNAGGQEQGAQTNLVAIIVDAVNMQIIIANNTQISIPDKTTRAGTAITVAKWKITFTPYIIR